MRNLFLKMRRVPHRFAKRYAKWILPVVGVISMVAIFAVAANIPIPAGNASRFVPGVPTAPVIGSIASGNGTLTVNFTAANLNGRSLTTYQSSTNNGAIWTNRSLLTSTSLQIPSLTNGTSYSVRIRAVSDIGQGLASNMVAWAPATAPTAPTIRGLTPGGLSGNSIVYDSAVQEDGKILVAGINIQPDVEGNGLVRYNRDGTIDTTFLNGINNTFYLTNVAFATVYSIDIAPDGKIYAGGDFQCFGDPASGCGSANRIVRLNANGTRDTSFSAGGLFGAGNGSVRTVEALPNGGVVIGGDFTVVNFVQRNRVAVLNSDGTTNTNFNPGGNGATNGTVFSVAVNPLNLDIYVGGSFTAMNGNATRTRFARFTHSAGSWALDTTVFNPRPNEQVLDLEFAPDGSSLYVGGSFTTFNPNGGAAVNRLRVARFDPVSGDNANISTTPASFAPTDISNGSAITIGLQQDGKLLVGGNFTSPLTSPRVLRFNTSSTGSLDTTFTSTANDTVRTVRQLLFGEVFVGGSFTSLSSASRNGAGFLESNGAIEDGVTWRYNGSANTDGAAYVRFASPSNTGGSGVTIQNYEYSINNGSTWTAFSPAVTSPAVTTATAVTIPSISNGTTPTVMLRAKNVWNASYGTSSNSATGTMCSVSAVPTYVVGTAGAPTGFQKARGLNFSTAPSVTTNNGCAISRYEYSTSVTANNPVGWTGVWTTASPTGVGADTTTGRPMVTATAYKVWVRGVNAAGFGAAATTATGTTLPPFTCTGDRHSAEFVAPLTAQNGVFCVFRLSTGTFQSNATISMVSAVVGGGGGGGSTGNSTGTVVGGGGGAGGYRFFAETRPQDASTVAIGIGPGGAGGFRVNGTSGGLTSFGNRSAAGGGAGGGSGTAAGFAGGSGGGAVSSTVSGFFAGGSGNTPAVSPSQGNAGGLAYNVTGTARRRGGGGGGAAGVGQPGRQSNGVYGTGAGGGCNADFRSAYGWTGASNNFLGVAGGGGGGDNQQGGGNFPAGGFCGFGQVGGGGAGAGPGNNGVDGQKYDVPLLSNLYGSGGGGGGSRYGTGGAGAPGTVMVWAQKQQ